MKAELKKALDKEKDLNNLKSEFVSMVSHEYRTPLTVIMTSTYLLEKSFHDKDFDIFQKNVYMINESIRKMIALIEQTTTYNNIENGKVEISNQKFDLLLLIKDTIEEFNLVKKKNQEIKLITNEKKLFLDNDERIIKQSVDNLLHNAIKYSPDNKEILIDVTKEGHQIIIRFIDQGIGIPDKDKADLFKPFHRSSNVNGTPGTGLGLTITKQNIESIGGRINYTSEESLGSTFEIKLRA